MFKKYINLYYIDAYKRWKGRGHLIYNVANNFFKKTFLTFWDFHKSDEKFPPKI